ncbi:ATP-utilizing protein of the PP-loop superfamily [Desulforapulum autotrophicum HRM2]|uniref:ATP-utilizing protein of the PP-loop superfamily n=1 Tax=Desulforapulum autotrophicum (strain ATCC 43914 / DSM 3382 / VKM B-1955 / HRM2) TaxID=177437 RepID=C0QBA2_DESAH|nr:ATP-dependent sacrificial sulfur transferase LarE [Desulforapulum autotrophicum]ACN14901.1 ATP-utilizing protein of the PP-loop superfamily [Desulforapulum autotrophicum HRM2]
MSDKLKNLVHSLKAYGKIAIAFSGGVDSAFLAAVAKDTCGSSVAITVKSAFQSGQEAYNAVCMAEAIGIRHVVVQADVLGNSRIVKNTSERCYFCKKMIFSLLTDRADELGLKTIVHGANVDDLADYRPGLRAAREMGVIAPLLDAGLTKNEIRDLSRRAGLKTWNMDAQSCLATRIPYGDTITLEKLEMVENGERVLGALGFSGARVRFHGAVARIELKSQAVGQGLEMNKISEEKLRQTVVESFKKIGFKYICLDLEGYVMGSMNRSLGDSFLK